MVNLFKNGHSVQMRNLPFPLRVKIHYTHLQHEGWADS